MPSITKGRLGSGVGIGGVGGGGVGPDRVTIGGAVGTGGATGSGDKGTTVTDS